MMHARVAKVPSISTGFVKAARASVQVDPLVRSPDIANRLSMRIDRTRYDSFVTPFVEVGINDCAHATASRAPIENVSASIDHMCASIAHLKRRSARIRRTIASSHDRSLASTRRSLRCARRSLTRYARSPGDAFDR
jgi:hypothetical protein